MTANSIIYLYASDSTPLDWDAGFRAIDAAPVDELNEQLQEAFPWYPGDATPAQIREGVKEHFTLLKEVLEADGETNALLTWNITGNTVYVAQDVDAGDYAPMSDYAAFETAYRFPSILAAVGLFH